MGIFKFCKHPLMNAAHARVRVRHFGYPFLVSGRTASMAFLPHNHEKGFDALIRLGIRKAALDHCLPDVRKETRLVCVLPV